MRVLENALLAYASRIKNQDRHSPNMNRVRATRLSLYENAIGTWCYGEHWSISRVTHSYSWGERVRSHLKTVFFVANILSVGLHIQPVYCAEYLRSENTAPASVESQESPLDAALGKKVKPPVRPGLEDIQKKLEDSPAWIRDASLGIKFRAYDFKRVNQNESINDATTLGGEIGFTSGEFAGIARLGLSYYFSGALDAPEEQGNTGLLTPDQQSLSVLGRAYLQLGKPDQLMARFYRQTLDMPFLNKDDSRMIPNNHEAYLIGRKGTGRDFVIGHVGRMKRKDSEEFLAMSVLAGAPDTDKGVSVLGFKDSYAYDIHLGGFNYYGWDTFNTAYLESNWISPFLQSYSIKAKVQYVDQRSIGEELVGTFDTHSVGLGLNGGRDGVILNLAYTQIGSGGRVRSPWGGTPLYNSMMLEKFNRAGEKGLRIGASLSSPSGNSGWSGFANITTGWDAINATTGEQLPDLVEYDLTLDYKPSGEISLAELWIRLRTAYADFDDGSERWNVRVIINYPLRLLN
jgi:hypothetical protein